MDVNFPPGTHLALTINGITREYSPIAGYLHVEKATGIPDPHIELMIRLVPNGALSGLLKHILSLDNGGGALGRGGSGGVTTKTTASASTSTSTIPLGVTMPCHVPCTIYGPLFPAPATFGYLPYYLPLRFTNGIAATALSDATVSTPVPVLVMIAGAFFLYPHNNILPFISIIHPFH